MHEIHGMKAARSALGVGIMAWAALAFFLHRLDPPTRRSVRSISIDLNLATIEQLHSLSQIGRQRAIEIYAARLERGDYRDFQELKKIKGMNRPSFERIKKYTFIRQSGNRPQRENSFPPPTRGK